MPFLFLAFVTVPIVEIALFIEIGGAIGTWPTIGAIVLTAAAGTMLLRTQGGGLMARARATLNRGEMPVEEVIHGLFLLVAGALLLTPGFFTDAVGLLLCVPPLRLVLGRAILRRLRHRMNIHVARYHTAPSGEPRDEPPPYVDPGEPPRVTGGPTRWRPPPDEPGNGKND
ncbi:MAG: FxsA family protein [Alphaproteobacteria bacterium]